ncbi:MAG TPA: NAD(P)-dependent oxidoreductase [Candidatus Limnocylindrales bacterium]|nr:NAD(P)-dependent oxidoreductase [Candidatus Limnocylindrales bacterium]
MAAPALPLVWFERPVLPSLVATVEAACTPIGPGTDADPYAGIERAVAAVVGAAPYDGALMDRAPSLRVIARTGIGYDAVDVEAATARGIAVCNTPDGPTISTAEHALTLILMVAKKVKPAEAALHDGTSAGYYARHAGVELAGKVLGLVGCGRIARRVGVMAEAIGMRVTTFDPYCDPSAIPTGFASIATLDGLLRGADVVSVHVPLTAASRGMFDAKRFNTMKPGAVFINTARGGLVDQDALLAALEAGRLVGAGLDVTSPEPLPPDHPLLHRDDVVVTPHVASATTEGKVRIFEAAFDQAMTVVRGERPTYLVNPEVWDRRVAATAAGVDK